MKILICINRSLETDVGYDGPSKAILTIKIKDNQIRTIDAIMLGKEHVQALIKTLVDHLAEMD